MKIYVSADIEGIWGVVSPRQIGGESEDYTRARKLMTQEVNLLCQYLLQNGASEIVINDSHGPMDNIIIEELNPEVSLISGYPKDLSMMEGIDESFDCVMLIGYHPKAGTEKGIFDHTYAGRVIRNLYIDEEELGEVGLNALVAGGFGVPVVLVSGDEKVTQDVKMEIGDIETVAVKKALSRYCAKNISFLKLEKLYSEAVKNALKDVKKYPIKKPSSSPVLKLELYQAVMAETVACIPGVKKVGPTSVEYIAEEMADVYKALRSIVTVAQNLI
ncbi:peptidase M55, D-aminopeptidase [Alkaliphilus metalliredigens QYMF]|uniref:Peptidase M55, D-aminopeptidase n=1 Tax=Alkaliphilus metalliredigens (strain QYMF) TaxID=293826 RepID=A6TPW1_ALKMQ|nr:M55 family metallopeptidase [Alkaliphilus metalliredigens]ABR48229.1 peptidase M55, D-aminopeptidase [Alkaliphilus metalliredigens QYMF]